MRAPLPIRPLVLLALAASTPALAAGESAFDLLQRMREAYLVLDAYRDEGDIEIATGPGGEVVERYAFETSLEPGGAFSFTLRPLARQGGAGAVTWNREAGAASAGSGASTRSLPAEIAGPLGAAAEDALAVAGLLAHGSAALADPESLAIEGHEPCGVATCLRLIGSRDGGARRLTLLVESASLLVREIAIEEEAALPHAPAVRALRVVVRPGLAVARGAAGRADPTPAEPLPTFSDRVEVALASLAVRVVDPWTGDLVRDLAASDFRLLADGEEIPIVAAEWVSSAEPLLDLEDLERLEASGVEPPAPGKLVVLFVQADLRASRMIGQLRTLPEAKRFLDTLGFEDRIAVVSYDSHLKLRLDFTLDRERVREELDRAVLTGPEPWIRSGRDPSLARHFDFEAARDAAKPERALELVARALAPLPGEKVIVWIGWGLGRLGQLGVEMPREYGEALDALARAKAAVFVLDVTDADYHSLEEGLRQVARDTGGTYLKTMHHPKAAAARLADFVSGFYRISFEPPADSPSAKLRVELRAGLRGEVVAPSAIAP